MAAKLILAVVAALCATQVVVAKDTMSFPFSPSAILNDMAKVMQDVEDICDRVDTDIEAAIIKSASFVNQTLVNLAERYQDEVKTIAQKADAAIEDVVACVDQAVSIKTILEGLRNDTVLCIAERFQAVKAAEKDVKALVPQVSGLVKKVEETVKTCVAKKNPISVTLCLMENAPVDVAEIAGLDTKLVALSAIVAERIAEVAPLDGLCVAKSTTARAGEFASSLEGILECVSKKLM